MKKSLNIIKTTSFWSNGSLNKICCFSKFPRRFNVKARSYVTLLWLYYYYYYVQLLSTILNNFHCKNISLLFSFSTRFSSTFIFLFNVWQTKAPNSKWVNIFNYSLLHSTRTVWGYLHYFFIHFFFTSVYTYTDNYNCLHYLLQNFTLSLFSVTILHILSIRRYIFSIIILSFL